MTMIYPCLIPACLILSTNALRVSWPWPLTSRSPPREHPWIDRLRSRQVPGLSKSEVDFLFLNSQSLDSYAHKPDCFKNAASRVRSACTDIDSIQGGMYESERIHLAITMTLCELNTALQPPPLECAPFSSMSPPSNPPSYWGQGTDSDRDDHHEQVENQASCVSALSRSPQSWSSYSGYLREVPQLCYAFRRWNDIDTARKIYANITLEKLSLLRHLHLREERWEEGIDEWAGVVKDLQDIMQSLRTTSADQVVVADQFGRSFDKTLLRFERSLTVLQMQEEAGYMHSVSRQLEQLGEALDSVAEHHEQTLLSLLPSLEHVLSSYLSELLVGNADVFQFGDKVRSQWIKLEADFATMHDSITSLSTLSTTLTTNLIHSQALSDSILDAQLRTHVTTIQMEEVLQHKLDKINETAVEIIEGLKQKERAERVVGLEVWNTMAQILGWVGRGIWGVDHKYVDQLTHLPLSRITLFIFQLLWYLFRSAFSSLMSVLVVLISSRRLFSGFFPVAHNVDLEPQSHTQLQFRHANLETSTLMLPQPPIPTLQIPRSLDLDPRLYIRSGPRFSRIPDRLCKSTSEAAHDRSGWE